MSLTMAIASQPMHKLMVTRRGPSSTIATRMLMNLAQLTVSKVKVTVITAPQL